MFIAKLLTAVIAGRAIVSGVRGGQPAAPRRAEPSPTTRSGAGTAPARAGAGATAAGAGVAAARSEASSSATREDAAEGDAIPAQQAGEAGPDSPLELQSADWKATLKRTLAEIKADRVTLVAAGMAYYFFLAIFPALIAFIGILGLVQADSSGIISSIRSSLPGGAGEVLTEAVANADNPSQGGSLVAALFGIALALWSATAGMVALQAGLNVAYDEPKDRKFIGKRLVGFGLLIATALLGAAPSPFFTFGEGFIFSLIGWVLTAAAIIVLFSIFYYFGPNRDTPTWQWVTAGGVVGALLWILAWLGFGFYASNFASYGKTYGPLAGVIVLIFWLYLSSIAVLVGGELNAELERSAARKSTGS
jgi:membrane protein